MIESEQQFLEWERQSRETIDVKVSYIDLAGDLTAGVLLSQIIYWFLLNRNGEQKTTITREKKRWIAKKRTDWFDEVRIRPDQVDRCLKQLEDKQLIESRVWRYNGNPTKHIRPVFEKLIRSMTDFHFAGSPEMELGERPNSNKEAETTPETTTENKTQTPSASQTGYPQPPPVEAEILPPRQDEKPEEPPLSKKRTSRQRKSKPCVLEPVDDRYGLFVGRISAYWKFKNPSISMPFDASDGKRIKELLSASPDLDVDAFNLCLKNRARSEVNHSQRPRVWIADLLQYAGGPLDRYGKPKQENDNGKQANYSQQSNIPAGYQRTVVNHTAREIALENERHNHPREDYRRGDAAGDYDQGDD